ncbi:MAG TPA: SDR family oxidoreductase [Ktedonobacterales bacterium]|nr:SDR family oxidoreductase [Ktedonobacterales bacterium]
MDLGLHGKTAIVTGASRGIGLAIASALHREGVSLVLVARSQDALAKAARDLTSREGSAAPPVHPIAADLGMRAEVERVVAQAIARLGHVDILVNNAAQAQTGSFFDMSEDDWQAVWQVKAFGYVRMVTALSRHMMERESGSIINIIGTAARTPTEDFIIGGMVNAALLNFTRGIARILAHKNVRINSISPGWTRTEGQQRHLEMVAAAQGKTVEEVERREARGVPLGRLVTMEEIAEMALLLASDSVPAMTGEDIIIDGGATPSI